MTPAELAERKKKQADLKAKEVHEKELQAIAEKAEEANMMGGEEEEASADVISKSKEPEATDEAESFADKKIKELESGIKSADSGDEDQADPEEAEATEDRPTKE